MTDKIPRFKLTNLESQLIDDKILYLRTQKMSIRAIADHPDVNLSKSAVEQRLKRAYSKVHKFNIDEVQEKRKIMVIEHEAVKKKAWEIINDPKNESKVDMRHKYLERIEKANVEISKLLALYMKSGENPGDDSSINGLLESLEASRREIKERLEQNKPPQEEDASDNGEQ